MFKRNYWYMATWADELSDRLLQRIILGEPVALGRDSAGKVFALRDQCAHRRMPLSKGRIDGDRIICPYHGFTYDAGGTCVAIPGQDPGGVTPIHSYPVQEKYGIVWIFMGEPSKAHDIPVFDCHLFEEEGFDLLRFSLNGGKVKANYTFINDNLCDLLHLTELHGDARSASGAGNWSMGEADIQIEELPHGLRYTRYSENIPPPPGFKRLGNIQGNADRWHIVDFHMPCYFRIYTGAAEHGAGGADTDLLDGEGKYSFFAHHLITPETAKTSHYYQGIAHQFPNQELAETTLSWGKSVIGEDIWAIECQQESIDLYSDSPVSPAGLDDAVVTKVHEMLGIE